MAQFRIVTCPNFMGFRAKYISDMQKGVKNFQTIKISANCFCWCCLWPMFFHLDIKVKSNIDPDSMEDYAFIPTNKMQFSINSIGFMNSFFSHIHKILWESKFQWRMRLNSVPHFITSEHFTNFTVVKCT